MNDAETPILAKVTYHLPGEPTVEVNTGDVILTHSTFLTGKIIRFGQRLRWRGSRAWAARWNHAALVVARTETFKFERETSQGAAVQLERITPAVIEEALGKGVELNRLSKYDDTEYAVIHTALDPDSEDIVQVLRFARSVLKAHTRYGYLEILSLGLSLLTPPWIQFGTPGTMICSGFVAQALTRAGAIWQVDPSYVMPAHIAELFLVK